MGRIKLYSHCTDTCTFIYIVHVHVHAICMLVVHVCSALFYGTFKLHFTCPKSHFNLRTRRRAYYNVTDIITLIYIVHVYISTCICTYMYVMDTWVCKYIFFYLQYKHSTVMTILLARNVLRICIITCSNNKLFVCMYMYM